MKIISKLPNFRGKGIIFNYFKKSYLKKGNPIIIANGDLGPLKIDLRSFEWEYFSNRSYDCDLMQRCLSLVNVDEVCVDVGANIGFWTIALARNIQKKGGKGRVVAFEPHPTNFKRLVENIEISGLGKYITACNLGLSDSDSSKQLVMREDFRNGSATGNASISVSKEYDKNFNSITVNVVTADKYFSTITLDNKIGFIKVDIEGHEDFFLRGAQQVLKHNRPTIMMEINLPYYQARGINDILNNFNALLPSYLFINGNLSSHDLRDLITKNITNVIAKPQSS